MTLISEVMNINDFLELDKIVEILKADGIHSCQWFDNETVKKAFLHWFEKHLEAINEDPQWFIRGMGSKHFVMPVNLEYNPIFDSESPEYLEALEAFESSASETSEKLVA